MSTTNESSWIKPFVTGVVATVATYHVLPKLLCANGSNTSTSTEGGTKNGSTQQKPQRQPQHEPSTSTSSSPESLMDSPDLDQRILRKAEAALQNRTSRLIIVIERCTNDHNYSAILRTAEALGVQHVYIIGPKARNQSLKTDTAISKARKNTGGVGAAEENSNDVNGAEEGDDMKGVKLYRSTGQHVRKYSQSEVKDRAQHHLFAQRAVEWLQVREFDTTKECIDVLKEQDYKIWSTDLSQVAVCLTPEGLMDNETMPTSGDNLIPEKLAIVFGTEAVGCTAEILNASDKRVYLPLRGFADSLNLSVATALVLHQLFTLDPTIAGAMPEEERAELRQQWYSKLASQRLLTKKDKVTRRRIMSQIHEYEQLEWRKNNPDSGDPPLQGEQLKKVDMLPPLREELKRIDDDLQEKSLRAVKEILKNPPQPISDMRRADMHRGTYVGKNTKKNHSEVWADMPATDKYQTEMKSSSFFRGLLKEDK